MNHIAALIQEAVQRAVGPGVIVSLSGGLDSATVAYFAGSRTPAITGWYHGEPYDERPWARKAKQGVHIEVEITPDMFVNDFDTMLAHLNLSPPWPGTGVLGQWHVAKTAASYGYRTLLTGEGGDELFGGYARLHRAAGIPLPDGYQDYQLPEGYPTTLPEALQWDWDRLPNLLETDMMVAAAFHMKTVTPLLHPNIVQHVLRLPAKQRVGKTLLREAMVGRLHPDITSRKDKRGFPTPFVQWAQTDPVRTFVRDRIGYTPPADLPWDREWWNDLCDTARAAA